MRILVIDDERTTDKSVVFARTYKDAIKQLSENGPWDECYLDHDLGEEKTGYDIIKWLEQNPLFLPLKIIVTTMNPIGKENIVVILQRLISQGLTRGQLSIGRI